MMDHGILNVPLAKRGNIDREIDKYKANLAMEEKREQKLHAQVIAQLRKDAKAHVASLSDERIAQLASKFGKTFNQMKKFLMSQAWWQPKLILGISKDLKE